MALTTVPTLLYPWHFQSYYSTNLSANLLTLDAAGEKAACLIRAPKSGNIRKIGFSVRTVTTSGTLDARIETVASGQPSGTLWATNTNASGVTINAANTWVTATLTADAVVARGDKLAVVLARSTGNFALAGVNGGTQVWDWPKTLHFFSSAWNDPVTTLCFALEYSDGSYEHIPGIWPAMSGDNDEIASNTTPDEIGVRFSLPYACRVIGAWASPELDAATDVRLYDSNGTTVLESITLASADRWGTFQGPQFWIFDTTVNLAANTVYRLALRPTTTTPIRIPRFQLDASVRAAMPGGVNLYKTSRTDDGSWTDDTTFCPWMGLIIDQIDLAAASGSLLRHPGMTGGVPA